MRQTNSSVARSPVLFSTGRKVFPMRAIARIAGRVRRSRARVSTARPLYRQNWVVYLKPPFGGPEYVLQYLGRYTHRVAISNHRLVSFTEASYTSFHKASCASVTSTSVLCQPPAHQELLSSRPQPQAEQHASSTEDTPGLYRCPPLWRTNERATRHRGRNPGPWGLRGESGPAKRCECQPSVLLAKAVS